MKKLYVALFVLILTGCKKVEESVAEFAAETKQKAEQKAMETVRETVNEQMNKMMNAENAVFDSVFPNQEVGYASEVSGKKIKLPTGSGAYIFKYKTADKDGLLRMLVNQPTTDEAKSSKEYKKIDGAAIIDKLSFVEKFLPANTIDSTFLQEIHNDKSIEYYRVKRFPNNSTIIYSPKKEMIYQLVEVKN